MQIRICDTCKDKRLEAIQAHVYTGKFIPDPAGGASHPEVDIFDVCLLCAVRKLELLSSERVIHSI